MAHVHRPIYDTPANKAINTAEKLAEDMSEGKVVDGRSGDRRQFDAMFYLMKAVLLELERIGDQLERADSGHLHPD